MFSHGMAKPTLCQLGILSSKFFKPNLLVLAMFGYISLLYANAMEFIHMNVCRLLVMNFYQSLNLISIHS